MRRCRRLAALGLWLLAGRVLAGEITHVAHHPEIFDPRAGESVTVRLHLTEPAEVTLQLFDARNRRVRTVASAGALAAGDHDLAWDGRDERGEPVPPEAYTYALEARGLDGAVWRWDVAPFGGEPVDVAGLAWDADSGEVRYRLGGLARVRIRIGLENGGPLLRTLVDWVPRTRGSHAEPWNGRGASGVLDLARHPALALDGRAFALPPNTVLVGPPVAESAFLPGLPRDGSRPAPSPDRHRMFDYARQAAEARRDFPVALHLPESLDRTAEGVPIVREPVPVRVEVAGDARVQAVDERSETVFFVDGRFVFERETGFLPMTWTWSPQGHAPGLHHLTVNVRSYEGHFGIGTIPVWVEKPSGPAKP